ncbi:ATP-dependent DNA ligase [Cupriavidus basilensis]|uniref:ATP-dependent DNA ligase n=1 Tax=Cupriavidus basilensis TaxID=68895 RepID=UPI0020A6D087|nr:ATP-dependent DNA ligase [Cupriavidus basilensis]MCP3017446.1 ATP-dependent DNA ligase [Cupriavidus basilensis]
MAQFKPMLAGEADVAKLAYPVYASPKLDGIRFVVKDGKLLTRSLKEVPNRHVFRQYSDFPYDGLDGEMILGNPTAEDCYRQTNSAVMSHHGEPDISMYVFDLHDTDRNYFDRYEMLRELVPSLQKDAPRIELLEQKLIKSADDLLEYEAKLLEEGHEGVIVRGLNSPYKYGRSTAKEGYLLKLKQFKDAEAVIVGFDELMHNANEATKNELGQTERSTHAENLVPMDTLGALVVRDVETQIQFKIGTGFTAEQRKLLWTRRHDLGDQLVKYKFFPVGVKVAPRHPVFLGLRSPLDM